jgi:cytoskeletal protein RodZ
MAITIGEKLRLAREERGISLRDISEQTRISMRYLEAIESDDYKRLPGGIFNRSFIKSYAKYIGYDEKEAIEAYSSTLRQKGETSEEPTTLPKSLVYTDASSNRSPVVTLLLAIIILAVLSLGAYAALHWYQRRTAPRGSAGPGQSVHLMTSVIGERGGLLSGSVQVLLLPGEVCSSC